MNLSQPWLRWFSKLVIISTLGLIFAGALVKSHEVGLSVPDWPTTYGKHMFTFPFSEMVGGIFYEHLHRLIATTIGILTIVLVVGLGLSNRPSWIKKMGYSALGVVILQGMLGGITVLYFLPPIISIFHGMLAQGFLIMTIIIGYSLSKEGENRESNNGEENKQLIRPAFILLIAVVVQLFLGALMRHTGSGLAIPDFPTIGGGWLPIFNDYFLGHINDIMYENDMESVSIIQIWIHYIHRLGALAVTLITVYFVTKVFKGNISNVKPSGIRLLILLIIKITLGATSIWTFRDPIITSLHVVTGAGFLAMVSLTILRVIPIKLS